MFSYQQKLILRFYSAVFWLVMTCKMMHQIDYGFYWSIKKWSKLGPRSFWLILFMPSCTLWVMAQDFAKWKTLLKYISVASFISIAFVVVTLKIFTKFFVLIQYPWNGPFLGFFGHLFPQILFNLAEILTRGSLQ